MKKLFFILLLLAAMNANAQWVQVSNGMGTDKSITSLAVCGNNIITGTLYDGVYLSTNSGASWSVVTNGLPNQTVRSFVVSGTILFAGTQGSGIFLSTNNGSNWSACNNGLTNLSVWSLAVSETNLFAGVVNGGLFKSTNNGLNWTQTNFPNMSVYSITTFGNNIFAGTYGSGVLLSTNNGTLWTQTSLNIQSVTSLTANENNIYAGTWGFGGMGVYRTTNNGTNWPQIGLNNIGIFGITVLGNNITVGTDMGFYLSTNNGTSWIDKNDGFTVIPSVSPIIVTNNYIFIGTGGESVWRRPLSELIGIQNISTEFPSKYSLSQNYPNPFNPTTNVKFSIIKSEQVELIVYDIQGREVQTLVNERLQPGTYEVRFDGSMLNSGVYFYRLIAGEFSETKRMLLIK